MTGRTGREPTARGDQRREAIVVAAAELLEVEGFAAVGHRAVAARAGVPLSATTYYFGGRTALTLAAMERLGAAFMEQARNQVASLAQRRRSSAATAEILVELVTGPQATVDDARLLAFYERYVQAGRLPEYRETVGAWTQELIELFRVTLEASGRASGAPAPRLLVGVVDGLLLASLVEGGGTRSIEPAVAVAVDALAP